MDLEHRGKDSFYLFRHPFIHLKYFHFFPFTPNTLINIWPIESSFMKLPICRFFVEIEKNKIIIVADVHHWSSFKNPDMKISNLKACTVLICPRVSNADQN